MHSYCEICDRAILPGDARDWLICVGCRRDITDINKLGVYCLSLDAMRSWRRIQLIEMLRRRGVVPKRLQHAPLDEMLDAIDAGKQLTDVVDAASFELQNEDAGFAGYGGVFDDD